MALGPVMRLAGSRTIVSRTVRGASQPIAGRRARALYRAWLRPDDHGADCAESKRLRTKTIYSRYSNKDEILQAVVRRSVDAIRRPAVETISTHAHDIEPQAFLSGLGRQIVTTISGEGAGLNRILFAEGSRFSEITSLYRAVIAGGAAIIRKGLEQWHKDGLLPLLSDPARSAALCLSMMTDQARIRSAIGEPLTPAEISAHVDFAVDLFLRSCGYKTKN